MTSRAIPGDWLGRATENWGRRAALITALETLDYRALHSRVGALAAQAARVLPERLSGVAVLSRSPERIAWALYLALHRGISLLPLDPDRSRLDALLESCRTHWVLCDTELTALVPAGTRAVPADWLTQPSENATRPARPAGGEKVQLLVATSGTTGGSPKAASLTGHALAAAVCASRERLGLSPGDAWLACLPLWHIGGLSILLRCLEAGASAVLHERFDAARVWHDLETRAITHLSLVPPMLTRLLDHAGDSRPPPTLRAVLVGGGPLSESLARQAWRAGWPICPSYGASEAGSQIATLCGPGGSWQAGDVGLPLPRVQVEIIGADGHPTQGTGRIRISGPVLMAGYARADGALGEGLSGTGFDTGDLGFLDAAGHLHVLGRADEVLVSAGENIHPAEPERLLMGCPGVREAAVTARPDPVWGHRLVALVVTDLSDAALEAWTRRNIPSRVRPRELIRVHDLPRNTLGKLERHTLPTLLEWIDSSRGSANRPGTDAPEPP